MVVNGRKINSGHIPEAYKQDSALAQAREIQTNTKIFMIATACTGNPLFAGQVLLQLAIKVRAQPYVSRAVDG